MHCVDVNVLVNAVVTTSPHHVTARQTLDQLRRSPGGLGLFSTVVAGFLRVSTNRRVLKEPLDLNAALGVVDTLTASPFVSIINPGSGHWSTDIDPAHMTSPIPGSLRRQWRSMQRGFHSTETSYDSLA